MALDVIHSFYCSKNFLDLAQDCKIKSGGRCAVCGEIFNLDELRAHHKTELTLDNIDDVNITLNPSNIEVICHNCHNKLHHRFGYSVGVKHIYLVYGSPCGGKTTYVQNMATRDDLVIDLDKIHRAICVCGMYDKPNATKKVAFAVRDYLLNEARTALARRDWQDAYIIEGCPDRQRREYYQKNFNAELVHIDTPQEECIKRAIADTNRASVQQAVVGWINEYWKRYRE